MNADIKLMLKIYKTDKFDWMGGEIKKVEDLTKHHIDKKENGGENDISNYALLTEESHQLLNYIEEYYPEDYIRLNGLFLQLNRSLEAPTATYYDEVRCIIKRVRKDMKNKRRGRK